MTAQNPSATPIVANPVSRDYLSTEVHVLKDYSGQEFTSTTLYQLFDQISATKQPVAIQAVREADSKETKDRYKKRLAKVLFQTNHPQGRSKGLDYANHLTGLIFIDLDAGKDFTCSQVEAKEYVASQPSVVACWDSPSGLGVHGLAAYSGDYTEARQTLEASLVEASSGAITRLDPQTKNLDRLTYLSWDPKPYLNTEAQPLGNGDRPSYQAHATTEAPKEAQALTATPETQGPRPKFSAKWTRTQMVEWLLASPSGHRNEDLRLACLALGTVYCSVGIVENVEAFASEISIKLAESWQSTKDTEYPKVLKCLNDGVNEFNYYVNMPDQVENPDYDPTDKKSPKYVDNPSFNGTAYLVQWVNANKQELLTRDLYPIHENIRTLYNFQTDRDFDQHSQENLYLFRGKQQNSVFDVALNRCFTDTDLHFNVRACKPFACGEQLDNGEQANTVWNKRVGDSPTDKGGNKALNMLLNRCTRNNYDPLKELFEQIPTIPIDSPKYQELADHFLETYYRIPRSCAVYDLLTEAVFLLMGAKTVGRVLKPGQSVKQGIILIGEQSWGKTPSIDCMVRGPWMTREEYGEGYQTPRVPEQWLKYGPLLFGELKVPQLINNNPDATRAKSKALLQEIPEVAGLGARFVNGTSIVEEIKGELSKQTLSLREEHAKITYSFPVHYNWVMTSNGNAIYTDTENDRFFPIDLREHSLLQKDVNLVNFKWFYDLENWLTFWGCMKGLYASNPEIVMPAHLSKYQRQINESHTMESFVDDFIEVFAELVRGYNKTQFNKGGDTYIMKNADMNVCLKEVFRELEEKYPQGVVGKLLLEKHNFIHNALVKAYDHSGTPSPVKCTYPRELKGKGGDTRFRLLPFDQVKDLATVAKLVYKGGDKKVLMDEMNEGTISGSSY